MIEKKLVFLSDTHNQHNLIDVPDGDIVIHCGDISGRGYKSEVEAFLNCQSSTSSSFTMPKTSELVLSININNSNKII